MSSEWFPNRVPGFWGYDGNWRLRSRRINRLASLWIFSTESCGVRYEHNTCMHFASLYPCLSAFIFELAGRPVSLIGPPRDWKLALFFIFYFLLLLFSSSDSSVSPHFMYDLFDYPLARSMFYLSFNPLHPFYQKLFCRAGHSCIILLFCRFLILFYAKYLWEYPSLTLLLYCIATFLEYPRFAHPIQHFVS